MDPVLALLQAGGAQRTKFAPSSRYYRVETAEIVLPGERRIVFLRRRFVPPAERFAIIGEHVVAEGDRIDNLAARYIGDPELFWQLCDANVARSSEELTSVVGRHIVITLPEGIPAAARNV